MKYLGIDKAIKEGNVLHVFSSATRLRVARIEKDARGGDLLAYSEAFLLLPCLKDVSKDYLNGGVNARDYKYEHVAGNGSDPYLNLDRLIVSGHKIDIAPSNEFNSMIKRGNRLSNGLYEAVPVPAVQLTLSSVDREVLKIVGANVDEVIERAEIEARYLTTDGVQVNL